MSGQGVVVLGMHRSGTSVATRLLSLLGLSTCIPDDLLLAHDGNARGHWESKSLVRWNDRLLASVGASWWCPPRAEVDFAADALVARYGDRAVDAFHAAHPTEPWIWKDPRTCLTLPFWRRVLCPDPIGVLVVRHPLEVAASLTQRSRFTPAAALALWERYVRQVVAGTAGQSLAVTTYDRMLDDPVAWCEQANEFLSTTGLPLPGTWSRQAVASFAAAGLRHSSRSWDALPRTGELSAEQVALAETMLDVAGLHLSFQPPDLPPETPTTEVMFSRLRNAGPDEQPAMAPLFLPAGTGYHYPRPSRPSVTVVVVAGNPHDATQSGRVLASALPEGSETILVEEQNWPVADSDAHAPNWRHLRRPGPLTVGQRLAVAVEAARGDTLVLVQGRLLAAGDWLEPLLGALRHADAGVASPVLLVAPTSVRCYGTTFVDAALNRRWITECAASEPVPSPLLSNRVLAVRRSVLEACGGLDPGMLGEGVEDAELCLRLWRMGYQCITVPASQVVCTFPRRTFDPVDFLHDVLRMATVHLSGDRLEAVLACSARDPAFPAALARVAVSDVGARRALVTALCPLDAGWYFDQFKGYVA